MVDVRTQAEIEWIGFISRAIYISWKNSSDKRLNSKFDQTINDVCDGKKILLLCRSGVRSGTAAKRAAELDLEAHTINGGFEGEIDSRAQRDKLVGCKSSILPWHQN